MADYSVRDVCPIAAENPFTFCLPSVTELAALQANEMIKIATSENPPSERHDAERMWVKIIERDDNDPPVSVIALSVLLDHDTSFLKLVGAPAGSAFERGADGVFHPAWFPVDQEE